MVTASGVFTTMIFTSSGSERPFSECFRALTSAVPLVVPVAWIAPFTPLISRRWPAASLPDQWKSLLWAATAAGIARARRPATTKRLLIVVVPVLVFVLRRVRVVTLSHLTRAADLQIAAERLHFELRRAGAQREAEPVLVAAGHGDREAGVEIPVEGRRGHRHVRGLRHGHAHVAVVRR